MTKQRYTAHCEWEETGWWVVTVRELPGAVTQSRRLDQVPGDLAEVIQLLTDEGPEAYPSSMSTLTSPECVGEEAAHAAELRTAAERPSHEAQEATAKAVRPLRAAGLTVRDVGSLLGVSSLLNPCVAPWPQVSIRRRQPCWPLMEVLPNEA